MPRYRFPPASLTQQATPSTVSVKPDLKKEHQFGAHKILFDPSIPVPSLIYGFTDGKRFVVTSSKDKKLFNFSYLYFLIAFLSGMSLFALGGNDSNGLWEFNLVLFISSLLLATLLTIRDARRPISRFIVFDRDTGLVLFPGYGCWKDLVVPFEQVECNVGNWVGKGGMHFIFSIVALAKPRGKWGRRREHFMLGWVHNERDALQQWAFINRFMDRAHPIPKEARENWEMIRWFEKNNLTIEKLMQASGVVDVDKRTGDFVIPPELRRRSVSAV